MQWRFIQKLLFSLFPLAALLGGCLEVSVELTDTTPPLVLSTIPADSETGVATNRNITATFNEAMDDGTINAATFTVTQGATVIAGAVSYVGVTATFAPTLDLAANTSFTATISNEARDLAGNRLAVAESWTFTTGNAPDTIAPTIESTIPADLELGVFINGNLSVFFSEPMDAATINNTTFTLEQGNTPIAGAVSLAGTVATFNPTADLAPNTVFTGTVTTSARDLAGNALALTETWTFTTGDAPDTLAPTVVSTNPADADIEAATNGNIIAVFSEPMDPSTINAATFTLLQGNTPVAGVVTFAGIVATFTPTLELAANTVFTASISTTAADLAGNTLVVAETFSFTTGDALDLIAPTVVSTIPADADTNIAINGNIIAVFSELMDPATINTTTFTLRQGNAPIAGVVSFAGTVATFTPNAALAPNTLFTGTITTGARDLAGNALVLAETWNFTTGDAPDTLAPTVVSTIPADADIDVTTDGDLIVFFSESMDPATINATTFTLLQGATPIPGIVTIAGAVATFQPTNPLASNATFIAEITTGVRDLAGNALVTPEVWTFTTAAFAGPSPVILGTASDFVILAQSGISSIQTSSVTGDIGVSPIDSTAITGFSLLLDISGAFSTSSQIIGRALAAGYTEPTPTILSTAISDVALAITDAAGRTTPDFTELGGGDISGLLLAPGLYKWSTGVLISTDVTLQGGPDDVWIFQIAGGLTQDSSANILLANGAKAKNIFWQVSGSVTLNTNSHLEGIVLSQTEITLATGSSVTGRLLSQTAVTLDACTVIPPAP